MPDIESGHGVRSLPSVRQACPLPGGREIVVRSTGDGMLRFVHQDCLDLWVR